MFCLFQTYNTDHQTPDSASTATAMFTRVKTNTGTIGFDNKIVRGDVESINEATPLKTILHHAQQAGKDTGFVTTTRVTHATPASLYAHSAERDWECYHDIEDEMLPESVHDIAWQLINQEPGNSAKVMMGGGFKAFKPHDKNDRNDPLSNEDHSDDYENSCHTNGR